MSLGFESFLKCPEHGVQYPTGSKCPPCEERWEALNSASQEDLENHLQVLGFTTDQIASYEGKIPWQVQLITNRPLTRNEKAYARKLAERLSL